MGDQPASGLARILADRRAKVASLRERGVEPYAPHAAPTHALAEVHATHGHLDPGVDTGEQVTVAGRVVARRELGRLAFLVLREDGTDLQLFVVVKGLDEPSRALLDDLDVGDWVAATGEVMTSRQGELSVRPAQLTLLSKSLRPLPEKHAGLSDPEARVRQRELDLVVNEHTRQVVALRSRVVAAIRAEMTDRGFVEVETPMLHPIPGGAAARPFVTHHNTLDADLYLRIAPELYLKRLVVGGMPRVFEVNRSFRNEGMSTRHNPEFTMLESYEAYADVDGVMALTEALVARSALAAAGTTAVTHDGQPVDLTPPYPRVAMLDLVRDATGRPELSYASDLDELRGLAAGSGVEVERSWGAGRVVEAIFEALVEAELWQPTFVTEFPLEISPLARRHRDPSKPDVTERFELFVVGREHANGFSELIDPDDQRSRFEQQASARDAGDDEAMLVDEPFLRALELGMPPAGGLGLGIDRLVMLLADVRSIRDVILFPTLRPET